MPHYLSVFFLFCSTWLWAQRQDYPFALSPFEATSLDCSAYVSRQDEFSGLLRRTGPLFPWLRHCPEALKGVLGVDATYLEAELGFREEEGKTYLHLRLRIYDRLQGFVWGQLKEGEALQLFPLNRHGQALILTLSRQYVRDLSEQLARPCFELDAFYPLSSKARKRLEQEQWQALGLAWSLGEWQTWPLSDLDLPARALRCLEAN